MLWFQFSYRSASKNFVHCCARSPKSAHGLNSMSQTPSGRFGALSAGFGTARQLLLTLTERANSPATAREDANTGPAKRWAVMTTSKLTFRSFAQRRTFQVTVLAIVFVLVANSRSAAEDSKPTTLERHGRALADRMCSACHAVGRRGEPARRCACLPGARSAGGARYLHRSAARGAHVRPSRHADVSVHARRCPCVGPLSKIYPVAVSGCRG
jgi:cytochrome c5